MSIKVTQFSIKSEVDSLVVQLSFDITGATGEVSYSISEDPAKFIWQSYRPIEYKFSLRGIHTLYLTVKDTNSISDTISAQCQLITSLNGNEVLQQHIATQTISVNALKTFILDTPALETSIITSDSMLIMTAAIPLSGHRAVAQVNGLANYGVNVIGITRDACLAGSEVVVQFRSTMEEPSWNWDIDLPIYSTSMGVLTQVVPDSGILQRVAMPLSKSKILIDIKEPIQL
jgi:hypothetical protein